MVGLVAGAAGLAIAGRAHADEPDPEAVSQTPPLPRFGNRRTLVLAGSVDLRLLRFQGQSGGGIAYNFSPRVDYFVVDQLSIGGYVHYGYSYLEPWGGLRFHSQQSEYGAGAEVGYDVRASRQISVWVKLGGYVMRRMSESRSPGDDEAGIPEFHTEQEDTAAGALIYVPFLFHPVRHFFLGIGPEAYADLFRSQGVGSPSFGQRLSVGVRSIVGGWF